MTDFEVLIFCLLIVFVPAVFALWAGWIVDRNLNR